MKYEFKIGAYPHQDLSYSDFPIVEITTENGDGGFWLASDLNCIRDTADLEYLISSLKKVRDGGLSQFVFGYDMCTIVCDSNECHIQHNYDNGRELMTIRISELYQLIVDWTNYLKEHKK